MANQKRIKALEEKVEALQKIISSSKIRLSDPNNEGKFLVLEFKDDTYKLFKETVTVSTSQDMIESE